MAYTTINKSTTYFNTKLYSGNGSTQSLTGVGFQPDWTWIKERSSTSSHVAVDAVRGVSKVIRPNETAAESTDADVITSFDSDGFSLGADVKSNENSQTYASWNWKAGNSAGSSNTDGTITSTVSANTTAGFSIVSYTGTGSAATIGHGLGVAPGFIIFRDRDATQDWFVYHKSVGATKRLKLNQNVASATSTFINDTTPSSTVFNTEGGGATGTNGNKFIAYCFAEKTGYSKFGSYIAGSDTTAKPNNNGPFIYTGFKPRFIMTKRTDGTSNWCIFDTERSVDNPMYNILFPNGSDVENTSEPIEVYSNGWKPRADSGFFNYPANSNWIYMAFGQSLVGSNNVPCTAR